MSKSSWNAKPNAIIAGTNKAGTTSLFRYLSDHPDICCSKVKELGFFNRVVEPVTTADWEEYLSYFDHCTDNKIVLEASPVYLSGGKRTANLIDSFLPNVKLIFILREPIERVKSNFYRRKERLEDTVKNVKIDDHISRLFDDTTSECRKNKHENQWVDELSTLDYAKYIGEYLEIIPRDRIGVYFYDDLKNDTRSFVLDVCEFLNIDGEIYRNENFVFYIENKTRNYRSRGLQKVVFQVNIKLESILNKKPTIRRKIRYLYNRINETKERREEMGDMERERLERYFKDKNLALRVLLQDRYPEKSLPDWLR